MNPAREGTRYAAVSFEVSGDRVAAFSSAIGEDGTVVPPTFLTVPEILAGLSRAVGDEDLGLDLARVVHAEQAYEWRRDLEVGETLDVVSEIESLRSKSGLQLLVLRTEFRDRAGDLVATGRSTLLERGGAA
jgi:MaoC dehydratase-like protein